MRIAMTAGALGCAAFSVLAAPLAAADSDGALADGQVLTAFDVADPAIGRLDPALLTAIQNATTAAAADGITMTINSGWRSPQFQQQLLDNAVQTYGSYAAARQYVQTPEASRHVTGDAVDVGAYERRGNENPGGILGLGLKTVAAPDYAGDRDGNGCVNVNDLLLLVNAWGSSEGDANWDARADVDGSGLVSLFDLLPIVEEFGKS